MTFEVIWKILVKKWILIVICFFSMGVGAFIVSQFMTPLYQSSAIVQVVIQTGSSQSDYNNLLASDQLVQTEAQLAVGDPVLSAVSADFPGLTLGQVAKEANSTPKLNTQLFEIDIQDTSPTRAADIANDIATTLIKQQLQVVQQDNSLSQQQIQQDLDSTRQKINDTSNEIASLQKKGADQGQLLMLQSQLSGLQQHYSQWQSVLAQLELIQAESGDFLRIVQPAQPVFTPIRPNKLLNISAGLIGGLFLGILLAILSEQLDTRVHTSEVLTQLVDWPVLGTIWKTRSTNLVDMINPQGHDVNVESYRILRTNVGFASIDKPLPSLLVTSAMPGDGKSTVAANLAIFMAKAGKNTLLIDADLRRPTQHHIFKLTADKKGLSNAVLMCSMPPLQPGYSNTSNDSLEQFFHAVETPNLRVMPSGPLPPNPSEFLDSKAMQRFFALLATCGAEIIIIDSPPIRGLSDASILASKVDGTLVVVDATHTHKAHLKQIKLTFEQVGAHVLGCVVNKQRHNRNDTTYYYYQQDGLRAESNHNAANTTDVESARFFKAVKKLSR
ncbi:MAG TPA: polysaccharide biosynthesis tyrosine autokinase [Ktedonobacteraceae bacterium]|nr:polysaccharide biosynthesis tyrosine autokinase [Ktedonobacteraceae bacterium]